MAANMEEHVFISYSTKDSDIALAICSFLESNGVPCWIAPRNIPPATLFPEAIIQGIRAAGAVLLIVSGDSARSNQVSNEVVQAGALRKTIVPFIVEETEIPDGFVYYIGGTQWIDATTSLKDHFPYLLDAVKNALSAAFDEDGDICGDEGEGHAYSAEDRSIYAEVADRYDGAFIWAIQRASLPDGPITVLSIGAKDPTLVQHRIALSRRAIKRLVCVCETERHQKAMEEAQWSGFECVPVHVPFDSTFESHLLHELQTRGVEEIDVIFSDERFRKLENLSALLRRISRRHLAKAGAVILRSFDDGSKICYPDPDAVMQYVIDTSNNLVGTTDRLSGRRLYTDLRKAGFRDVALSYVINDTAGMSVEDRMKLFEESFAYRLDYFKQAVSNHPGNELFEREFENMRKRLDELEDLFCDDSFFYMETNFFAVAKR